MILLRGGGLGIKDAVADVERSERDDQLRHRLVTSDAAETRRRVGHGGNGPAQDHLTVAPALDSDAQRADGADEVLDCVGRGEDAFLAPGQPQPHHGERLIEPRLDGGRGARVFGPQSPSQVGQEFLRAVRVAAAVRLSERLAAGWLPA